MGFEHCIANQFLLPLAVALGAPLSARDVIIGARAGGPHFHRGTGPRLRAKPAAQHTRCTGAARHVTRRATRYKPRAGGPDWRD